MKERKRTRKNFFSFNLCRCSMWTLNWILCERIWKRYRFRSKPCFLFKMYDFKQITHCAALLCSVKHAALLETNIDTGIIIGVQSKIARRITWETVDKNPIISSLNLKDLHANILFSPKSGTARLKTPHICFTSTFYNAQQILSRKTPIQYCTVYGTNFV